MGRPAQLLLRFMAVVYERRSIGVASHRARGGLGPVSAHHACLSIAVIRGLHHTPGEAAFLLWRRSSLWVDRHSSHVRSISVEFWAQLVPSTTATSSSATPLQRRRRATALVSLWRARLSRAVTYWGAAVAGLSAKAGFRALPHMLQHSFATEMGHHGTRRRSGSCWGARRAFPSGRFRNVIGHRFEGRSCGVGLTRGYVAANGGTGTVAP